MRLSTEGAVTFRNYMSRKGVSLPSPINMIGLTIYDHQGIPFDLSVNVLTASYWPQGIIAASPLTLPSRIQPATTTFQAYYDSRHNGRRLTWQGNLGTADIKVRFKNRTHDLNVSTQALVVLLLFEDTKDGETLGYNVCHLSRALPPLTLV
jgi:cullin 3